VQKCRLFFYPFDTVEELRMALLEFKQRYNDTWLIGRHGYKMPSQVRQEQLATCAKQAA
jgi:putative transposase